MCLTTGDVIVFLLLGVSAVAQQITLAAKLSHGGPRRLQHRQQGDGVPSSVNFFSAINSCYSSITGCNIQLFLYSGCDFKYGIDFKELCCLCTTGYWDAVHQCDCCTLMEGTLCASVWMFQISFDNSNCASLISQYETSAASDMATTRGSSTTMNNSSSAAPNVIGGGGSTATPTATIPGVPSSTFFISMNGSPTAPIPTVTSAATEQGADPATSVSSAAGYIGSSVSARLFAAVACIIGLGWILYI